MDLEAIKRRAEAATDGPWAVDDLGLTHFERTNHRYGIGADQSTVYRLAKVEGMGGESECNAVFIAHAREDIPALIAEVERLLAEVERLKRELGPRVITETDGEGNFWYREVPR